MSGKMEKEGPSIAHWMTLERTFSPEQIAQLLDTIRVQIEEGQKRGKTVKVEITSGLHEWEESGSLRRKFDGSREITITIPADRLGAAPVEWSEEKSRTEALARAGVKED